jgi:hypothetical protein
MKENIRLQQMGETLSFLLHYLPSNNDQIEKDAVEALNDICSKVKYDVYSRKYTLNITSPIFDPGLESPKRINRKISNRYPSLEVRNLTDGVGERSVINERVILNSQSELFPSNYKYSGTIIGESLDDQETQALINDLDPIIDCLIWAFFKDNQIES